MRLKAFIAMYVGMEDDIIEVRFRNGIHRLTVEAWIETGSTPLTNRKVVSISVYNNELHLTVD